jgi:hypothetical protein
MVFSFSLLSRAHDSPAGTGSGGAPGRRLTDLARRDTAKLQYRLSTVLVGRKRAFRLPTPHRQSGSTTSDRPRICESPFQVPEMQSAIHLRERLTFSVVAVCIHNPGHSSQFSADTQPQLQPALLRLSALISQCFARSIMPRLNLHTAMGM